MQKIAFRTDASDKIGIGHLMRCLTLADALRARFSECVFVCRSIPENLARRVREAGHSLLVLPAGDDGRLKSHRIEPVEAIWSDETQADDARLCQEAIGDLRFDWMIVDHYGLNRRWHGEIRRIVPRVMVIDDLANRAHDCDLLLDQNLGRKPSDYEGLVSASAQILAGPAFALLRPQFAESRVAALNRRTHSRLSKLLISVGGSDPENITGRLLRVLNGLKLPQELTISAVLGPLATCGDDVRSAARAMCRPIEILVDVSDMTSLMVECDLAIGAAGATAWERCCLGLPTLIVIMAENQRPGAEALNALGAAMIISIDTLAAFDFVAFFDEAQGTSPASKMSGNAASICDGLGVYRVCEAMNV